MTKDDLFAYLSSDQNEHGLDPIAAHGFLCASVVGKPLPDWLDVFFEGKKTRVDEAICAALSQWRKELDDALKNEEPLVLPFDTDEAMDLSDESDAAAWCIGFVDAMYADGDTTWFDDPNTEEEVAALTLPMVVLAGIDDEDGDLASMRQDRDLALDLVAGIEDNLTELFLLFRDDEM